MFVSPRYANLLITGRCNLSCRHCTVYSHGPLSGELTAGEWGTVLDRLAEAKLLSLTISGGEPLMRDDFPEILMELTSRPFRLSLNTNNTLITEDTARILSEAAPRLDMVMISLDGDSPAVHDALRGEGVFQRVMNGVEILREWKLPICFYCTVNSLNAHRIDAIAEVCTNLGQYVIFNIFVDSGPETDSDLNPSPEQVAEAGRSVLRAALRYPGKVRGTLFETAAQAALVKMGRGIMMGSSRVCGGGSSKIAILPNGSVSPCDHTSTTIFGNLLRNDLETILSGERAVFFRDVTAMRRWPWMECESCKYRHYCSGPCPAGAPIEGASRDKFSMICLRNYIGE